MGRHSTAARLLAWLLAGTMVGFGAQPAGASTAMVFMAKDGTGIYARTMELGASDLKSELMPVPRATAFAAALGAGR